MASNVANIKIRNHNCKQGRAHLKYKLRAFLISLFGELYKTVGQKTKTKPNSQNYWLEQGKTTEKAALNTPAVLGNRSYCSHALKSFACPAESG